MDAELWIRKAGLQRLSRALCERGVALDDERECRFVEAARVVQQPEAHLAAIAGAKRNSRMPGNQRRLEGVRQDDGAIVPRQRLREAPARSELEIPVAERQRVRRGDLRHAAVYGKRPRRGEDVDRPLRIAFLQPDEQGMGENRITDPGWSDDERPRHQCPWEPASPTSL